MFLTQPTRTADPLPSFLTYGMPLGRCAGCGPTIYALSSLTVVKLADGRIRTVCSTHGGDRPPGGTVKPEQAFQGLRDAYSQERADRRRAAHAAEEARQERIAERHRLNAGLPKTLPPLTVDNKETFSERWLGRLVKGFRS